MVTQHLLAEKRDGQLTEFMAGLDKHLHKAQVDPNRANMQALVAYVRSWLVSLKLAGDPEWRGQIAESERRVKQGDWGEPTDAEHLRSH